MIILIHDNTSVIKVLNEEYDVISSLAGTPIAQTVFSVAEQFPDELIIWCCKEYEDYINLQSIESIFHHNCMMASYSLNQEPYLTNNIGFVNESIFVSVNKEKRYPTWLMSSDVGGIHASILNKTKKEFFSIKDFSFLLNAIAKTCMPLGLFCYSDPAFLKENTPKLSKPNKASTSKLFKFVRLFYKPIWSWFLLLSFVVYKGKFPALSVIRSFFYKYVNTEIDLSDIHIQSNRKLVSSKPTIDVIIPTIGRKEYLYDVLKDLSVQTHLPKQVIVVEQNPDTSAISELDYLNSEEWPFKICHHFINRTGACNARNLALSEVTSEWIFLADDDNRFENNVIEQFLISIKKYGEKALLSIYLQPQEENFYKITTQTDIFGAGNSFIKSSLLNKIQFDMAYEYGYGEDKDFGMQIRNQGNDILYDTSINIVHLKAPRGGFRQKVTLPWDGENVKPKPSPTLSVYNLKHFTTEQLLGYKLVLFLKYYKQQSIRNPISYYKLFRWQWTSSIKWAKYLING